MFVEDAYSLGYINKAHGINGELVIRTDLNFSDKTISNWESVFFKVEGILVPFFVERINRRNDSGLLVKFEDIDDEIQAKRFVGTSVFLDKKHQAEVEEGLVKLVNYQAFNSQNNILGQIVEIVEYPSQSMFILNTTDGEEIEIPAIEEWIVSVNETEETIILNLPDGLIEINQKDEFF